MSSWSRKEVTANEAFLVILLGQVDPGQEARVNEAFLVILLDQVDPG